MAKLNKTKATETDVVETNVEATEMVEETNTTEVETDVVEEAEVDTTEVEADTTEVDVETAVEVETEVEKADVEVDTKSAEVSSNSRTSGNVKIKMRVDHKCCIAMERYDLKAGKTYVVPENVKRILNKAGLLAPL